MCSRYLSKIKDQFCEEPRPVESHLYRIEGAARLAVPPAAGSGSQADRAGYDGLVGMDIKQVVNSDGESGTLRQVIGRIKIGRHLAPEIEDLRDRLTGRIQRHIGEIGVGCIGRWGRFAKAQGRQASEIGQMGTDRPLPLAIFQVHRELRFWSAGFQEILLAVREEGGAVVRRAAERGRSVDFIDPDALDIARKTRRAMV